MDPTNQKSENESATSADEYLFHPGMNIKKERSKISLFDFL